MSVSILGNEIVEKYRDQNTITVATGATCAYLGDERNLREYLVANETVKQLRDEGHIVHFLLFNDDLDPLNFRQLRVAVKKDPNLVEEFEPYCGKPISEIRAPYGLEGTWSNHFEDQLRRRLAALDCHPTILSVSKMYARGMYAPYIKQVLLHQDRIREYLAENFAGYNPEKLFWAICPTCGYIDGTDVSEADENSVLVDCHRCLCSTRLTHAEVRGKLSWKLDCAARWSMFRVHIEPFSKSYLEPKTGTFTVTQGLSKTFFGGQDVTPLQYGTVSMASSMGYRILDSLPPAVVKSLFIRHYRSDLDLTEERIMTEANRVELLPDFSFTDMVKQLLPAWLLDPKDLSAEQREILSKGLVFSREFLHSEVKPLLPNRANLEGIPLEILRQIQGLIQQVLIMRKAFGIDYNSFMSPAKSMIEKLGDQRKPVINHLRKLIGQEGGVPNSRFLFLLPVTVLQNLESLVDLYLQAHQRALGFAVVQDPALSQPPALKVVPGERLAFEH